MNERHKITPSRKKEKSYFLAVEISTPSLLEEVNNEENKKNRVIVERMNNHFYYANSSINHVVVLNYSLPYVCTRCHKRKLRKLQ